MICNIALLPFMLLQYTEDGTRVQLSRLPGVIRYDGSVLPTTGYRTEKTEDGFVITSERGVFSSSRWVIFTADTIGASDSARKGP